MSTQYGNGGETMEKATGSGTGAGAGATGNTDAASGANAEGGQGASSNLNWGSARSDYGENAYGGSLNDEGLGGKNYDDFREGRGDTVSYRKSASRSTRGGGEGVGVKRGGYSLDAGSTGLTLLAGMVIGATLMYIFDPQQGNRRRALMRDKLVGLSNDAACALGKTSRDLRNRAQGVIAETTKAIGLRGQGESSAAGSDNAQGSGGANSQAAGAGGVAGGL